MTLFLHAPNIHQGGGKTLLLALLSGIGGFRSTVLIDQRLTISERLPPDIEVFHVPPTILGRLRAEATLRRLASAGDVVLCLGNLPPLWPIRGRVVVFLQNRYLLKARHTFGLPWRVRIRLSVERWWLRRCLRGARLVVQTPSMADEALTVLDIAAEVLPFAAVPDRGVAGETKSFDYLYVASGEPHKNHRRLVEAWRLLASDGLRPSLALTLDCTGDRALCDWIEEARSTYNLRIDNLGSIPPTQVARLYANVGALVYPSLFESMGLPLVEAAGAGLPILAGELDYVRDIATPVQTFDPHSPRSIARAIRRHMGRPETPITLLSPADFLAKVEKMA